MVFILKGKICVTLITTVVFFSIAHLVQGKESCSANCTSNNSCMKGCRDDHVSCMKGHHYSEKFLTCFSCKLRCSKCCIQRGMVTWKQVLQSISRKKTDELNIKSGKFKHGRGKNHRSNLLPVFKALFMVG